MCISLAGLLKGINKETQFISVHAYVLRGNFLVIWVGSCCFFYVQHQFTNTLFLWHWHCSVTAVHFFIFVHTLHYCVCVACFNRQTTDRRGLPQVFIDQMDLSFPQAIIWSQSLSKEKIFVFGGSTMFLDSVVTVLSVHYILFCQQWAFWAYYVLFVFRMQAYFLRNRQAKSQALWLYGKKDAMKVKGGWDCSVWQQK